MCRSSVVVAVPVGAIIRGGFGAAPIPFAALD
jgi:hypothetical protein